MSDIDDTRYEVVRVDGPDGGIVELWDRALAPGGLALEVLQRDDGPTVLTGHGISVPLEVAEAFLLAARGYLLP